MPSPPLLFLSHAGEDGAAAREMARRLRDAGVDVWLDLEALHPGDRWMEALEKALTRANGGMNEAGRRRAADFARSHSLRLELEGGA